MKRETADLLRRAQEGDREALGRLTEENAALVVSVARRFFGRGAEPEDLIQLGSIGLIKAIRDFDLSMGVEFSTYAVPKIIGEIRRFLRDDGIVKVSRGCKEQAAKVYAASRALERETGQSPRLSQLCQRTGLTQEAVTEALRLPREAASLEAGITEDGLTLLEVLPAAGGEGALVESLALREALTRLPPRLRQVILLRYVRDLTQQKTAQLLGVSQVQVSRLEKRAVGRLRELLA